MGFFQRLQSWQPAGIPAPGAGVGGAGRFAPRWHVWSPGRCQGGGTGTEIEVEKAEPPSRSVGAAPVPASQPLGWLQLFRGGAGNRRVRGFSSCTSCLGESETESECSLFTSHPSIHERCELASYVARGWAGTSFWSPASFLQRLHCSEGEN